MPSAAAEPEAARTGGQRAESHRSYMLRLVCTQLCKMLHKAGVIVFHVQRFIPINRIEASLQFVAEIWIDS